MEKHRIGVSYLVSWSLTSLFSTNMATSETSTKQDEGANVTINSQMKLLNLHMINSKYKTDTSG